ncbi:MAG TPA: thioesterase family protein [Vicinamibacteria bacterium]|nr:thioesterase family protein [Vicinamibacteria bacterium]
MPSASFFVEHSGSGSFRATENTRGPWDHEHQHAGPPSALLARALERLEPKDGLRIVRVTTEILRPVPIAALELDVSVVRPGRSVELLEGALRSERHEVMRARAWRMRETDIGIPQPECVRMPPPEDARPVPFFPTLAQVGYHTSMEWRFFSGGFNEPGPGKAWLRMKLPLLPGEEPSPLTRTIVAADSGNGVSSPLDYQKYLFVNTDLTIQLYREPQGEWIGLDGRSHVEPTGVGLTETVLHDRSGPVGRAMQTLFDAAR